MSKAVRSVFKDYELDSNILECIIVNVNLYKKSQKIEVELASNANISAQELADFEEYLRNKFGVLEVKINIENIVGAACHAARVA